MSNAYVSLWTKVRCAWLRRVRDSRPLLVLFGGPHLSLPSMAARERGRYCLSVWVSHGQLRIIARMQVGRIITLAEYASEYVRLGPLPAGPVDHDFPRLHPELGHRSPFGCIDKVAFASMGTQLNFERSNAPQELPLLRFGPKPGREKSLTGLQDGRLSSSLNFQGHVRRASEQTRKILAAARANS